MKLQYTNLSLDVITGATVEEMIQRYFTVSSTPSLPSSSLLLLTLPVFAFSQEEDVVFRCEWCEGSRSVLSSSLETLPR